jgi:hypothetical protein
MTGRIYLKQIQPHSGHDDIKIMDPLTATDPRKSIAHLRKELMTNQAELLKRAEKNETTQAILMTNQAELLKRTEKNETTQAELLKMVKENREVEMQGNHLSMIFGFLLTFFYCYLSYF